ncbi:hypothetical protein M3Y94_00686400 [Aphelenchoides besseyi]|nr:hypothetical protein M3Y94_00686400 [Aphelenchoides besseyi]
MDVERTDSSSTSIQLPITERPHCISEDDSSTQNDEPTEIVIPKAHEQTEIEKLEAALTELGRDWSHHSIQLRNSLAIDIMGEPILPDYSLKRIDFMKLIVIAAASFLLIRLIYMTDLIIFLALFESISLIIFVVGLTSEEHYFFWPFVLSCAFELFALIIQFLFVLLGWMFGAIDDYKTFLIRMEIGFTPHLTDKMNTLLGFMQLSFYMLCKMIAFEIATVAIFILACELSKKEGNVGEQRKRLDQIQRQKVAVVNRLELLRANP